MINNSHNYDWTEIVEQILEKCQDIIEICDEGKSPSAENKDNSLLTKRYTVRILKMQPTKVIINGQIKDRANLSANEREAVRTQEEIDRARAKLNEIRQKRIQKKRIA